MAPFKVGGWLVEPELVSISKNGTVCKLEFRSMEILLCLVANAGEVVSKQKLHDEVWGEVHVTSNSLTRGISKLRKAFDDDPLNPKYIDTISKSGYRLVAPVVFDVDTSDQIQGPQAKWAAVNRRWLWALVAILAISGLGLMGGLSGDNYSEFYDPVPVSTLVGPELGLAISPDGEKISFTYSEPGANNLDIYVKLLNDLSQVKFTDLKTHQAYSVWSPDGNYMAYASLEDGTCGIYKEPSFGGQKMRIGSCFQQPEDLVWSPDGKTIAFTDLKTPQEARKIFFLNIETQVVEEISVLEKGMSDRDPVFSPDGKHLVFRRTISGQGRDLYKMRIADKAVTRLTFDKARILGLDLFDDGEQVVFASNRGGLWALWKVPFGGGTITRFYINDRVPSDPRFSANGSRMIYKSIRDQTRIWAIDKNDSGFAEPKQVASSTRAEIHPLLSRDGKKVVFISDRSGYFEIWSNDFEDNNPTKLTSLNGSFVNMPSWSADGSEVVFDARIDGDNAIYILDVASKLKRTFIDLEGDQVNARYSRDGKTIYFASNHSGTWQIWKKAAFDPKSPIEQVTINGGYYLQEGPDDDYLYYSRSDTSGIWRTQSEKNPSEELWIASLSDIDWGNWAPVQDGIVYVDRNSGQQLYYQSYNREEPPVSLSTPAKQIQLWSPSLSATFSGEKILYVQIESSEDEIMMVNFR